MESRDILNFRHEIQPKAPRGDPSRRWHRLIDPLTVHLSQLPGELAGLRILQISDLHARRPRRRFEQVEQVVAHTPHDLLVFTGDYMESEGDEPYAHELMMRLARASSPRLGRYGVFGNHDSMEMRRRLRHVDVHWLDNQAATTAGGALTLLGVACDPGERKNPRGDLLAALGNAEPAVPGRLRILLAHVPNWLPAAADAGIDLTLSGHTHGGQLRLPLAWARIGAWCVPGVWYNATPHWPMHLSSGLLRSRGSVGLIARGLGEAYWDGLRLFCPPHAPLIRLEGAEDSATGAAMELRNVRWW